MTRTVVLTGLVAAIFAGGIYIGMRADDRAEAKKDLRTIEDIQDAKDNAGDCSDDWFACLLRHRE